MGFLRIGDAVSVGVAKTEGMFGFGLLLVGSFAIPPGGAGRILGDTLAAFVEAAEIELGQSVPLLRRFLIPLGGFAEILRHSAAGVEQDAEVELRERLTLLRRLAKPLRRLSEAGEDSLCERKPIVVLSGRMAGFRGLDVTNLAVATNARGGPGIVLASVAYEAGIISAAFYTTLVIVAVLTSQAAGAWLEFVLRKGWPLLSTDAAASTSTAVEKAPEQLVA